MNLDAACTIVLLPLRSLFEQYESRCRLYGISCQRYAGFMTHSKVLLCSFEHTEHPAFRSHVDFLIESGPPPRLIFDEAQLIMAHQAFRPIMGLLQWLGGLPVQIVLQSATVLPTMESTLLSALGTSMYTIC